VGTSLASVDHVEVLQWESKLGREFVDSGSKVALGERSELVEEWLDCLSDPATVYGMGHTESGVDDL
jgi:hypothetical protein